MGEVSEHTRNRIVIDGPHIVTINANGVATRATVAIDNHSVRESRGRSVMEYYEHVMTPIGARRTGQTGSFAGHQCEYWEIPSMGSRECITSWGLALYRTNTIANVTEETATEVRIGDGGPDSAFAYDSSRVVENPNPLTRTPCRSPTKDTARRLPGRLPGGMEGSHELAPKLARPSRGIRP
jgi:hypothetical protein